MTSPHQRFDEADYLVLGGGSAGCVVARTLAERGFRIHVIEAGAPVPTTRSPAMYVHQFGTAEDWAYRTVAQPNLAGRAISWPRGRGPGGSSRINATIWLPPTPRDLNSLHQAGGERWSPAAVTASYEQIKAWVRPESPRWLSESTKRFLDCAGALAPMLRPLPRMTRQGRRITAHDLVFEARSGNRVSWQYARVQQIVFERGRAMGVLVADESTSAQSLVYARHSIIVCGGTLGSAELLMRSGIGAAEALEAAGIPVVMDSAHVGQGLSDHLIMPVIFGSSPKLRFPNKFSMHDQARFAVGGTGPLASNLAEAGGLIELPSGTRIQLHITPTHYLLYPQASAPAAMSVGVNLCVPTSKGQVRLTRVDVSGSRESDRLVLEIDPAYLSTDHDQCEMEAAVEYARHLARACGSQMSIKTSPHTSDRTQSAWLTEELLPGSGGRKPSPDAASRTTSRAIARFSQSLYHPTGTCHMGVTRDSVVDDRLAVRGTEGLYVCDASVLPSITEMNPNATVMTLAYHAASQWL